MIFKQLFEPDSCTFTYLLGCEKTGESLLIDPVIDTVERDLEVLKSLQLRPTYTLGTHVHADHLTGARKMKAMASSQIVVPSMDNLPCADLGVEEGKVFQVGSLKLHPLFTPGHTSMHQLLVDRARLESKNFSDEKTYKKFLYDLFPHEPVRMLCKLAGLPKPADEVET